MNNKECRAAGIIIYRIRNGSAQILGLEALPRFQKESFGKYDIPKGQIDPGETPEECARRECFEESDLKPDMLLAGPLAYEALWFWLAECDKTPKLKVNQTTGMLEHSGYAWLEPDTIIDNCLNYLKPALVWAREELCTRHLLK